MQNSIPKTKTYIELKELNAPLHLKWIKFELQHGTLQDNTVSELYTRYKDWIGYYYTDKPVMTLTSFGLLLNENKDAGNIDNNVQYTINNIGDKHKSHGVMLFKWNIENIIIGLKNQDLLSNDFIYRRV